jgi:hypothetical protein
LPFTVNSILFSLNDPDLLKLIAFSWNEGKDETAVALDVTPDQSACEVRSRLACRDEIAVDQ